MEETLFGMAQVTTASSSVVPVELPDIHVTDRANVIAKKVTIKKPERIVVEPPRECWTGRSLFIRADETKISSVAKRPGCTPPSTSPAYQRSRSCLATSPRLLKRTDSTNSGHMLHSGTQDMYHTRRYSSPNLSLTTVKASAKPTASLPGSPQSIRSREPQISSSFPVSEMRESLPPRAQSFSVNCFGRKHHTASDSQRPLSSSKVTKQTKLQPSFKSVFNDLDMNPVMISPLQLRTWPNNMHRREIGFELRQRVMRRACRLSDLSAAGPPEGPGTRHLEKRSPEFDGTFNKSQAPIEEKNSFVKDDKPESLEEQFKVLQHCRYLRGPVDNQL